MAWCPKCNLEYIDGSNACSGCGSHLEEKHIQIYRQTVYKKNMVLKVILILCLLYALIGFKLWVLSMIDTDWSIIRPLCCGDCDKVWYSQYWNSYFWYTLPFAIMTFPIYIKIGSIGNSLVMSVLNIYLIFVPLLIFLIYTKLRQLYGRVLRKVKK
ncbi:hypothetical protein A7W90_16420 [Clostridium sp. Bc-iso-3]|nr:hypothetical protein A7W90_16420 [Clostridium sp. Bc-iso-3]